MNTSKSLLTRLSETFDEYHADRRRTQAQDLRSQPGRIRRFLRWLTPNGGTLLLIAVLLLTQDVWARQIASPAALGPSATTVNYQGRLADSGGTPLDGTYGMSFSLWDAASDGSLVWGPESHAAVPVSEGLFSVGLGSQTSGGIPTTVWNGDRYLEITVGGETLSPRELIRSVPIAGMALTVPDGAVTSRQVQLTNGKIAATDHLSLTTTPQVIPGMSVILSPATNQTYIFYLVAEFGDSASVSGYGAATLYVDGALVRGGQYAVMGWRAEEGTAAQAYRVDLSTGTHSIEVRALSSDGTGKALAWHTSLTWLAVSQ